MNLVASIAVSIFCLFPLFSQRQIPSAAQLPQADIVQQREQAIALETQHRIESEQRQSELEQQYLQAEQQTQVEQQLAAEQQTQAERQSRLAQYSAEEIDLLCRITAAESRGEPARGQQAVVNVILNRVASGNFPSTISEVVFQSGQFSPASRSGFSKVPYDRHIEQNVLRILGGERVIPNEVMYFNGAAGLNRKLWQKIGNHHFYY